MTAKQKYSIIGFFLIAILVAVFGITTLKQTNQADVIKPVVNSDTSDFWVLSDPHFIADNLHDEGARFTYMMHTAASKDLKHQSVGIRALVQQALKDKPNAIVITGDVTFNGEKGSIDSLAKYFKPLKAANIKLFAIPGNHDIYDGWARKFVKNDEIKISQISPKNWKKAFPDGYQDVISRDQNSLSSSLQFDKNHQFILLDSNYYSIGPSNRAPATNGYLRDETIKWFEQQLKYGKKHHLEPILFLHHNLLPHSSRSRGGLILDNIEQVKPLLKKYHVKVDFAGHIHAQDIAADLTKSIPTTEILSGSFAVSPKSYGVVHLTKNKLTYDKKILNLKPYLTKKELKNPDLTDYQAYLKKLFFDDTKAIIYDRLYEQTKEHPEIMDQAAETFAEMNWLFFTGNDHLTQAQIEKFKQQPGYKYLVEYAGYQPDYADKFLNDTNLEDNHLVIETNKKASNQ